MDVSYLIRALVALLLGVFLGVQARALHDRPHRKRAFNLAAAALLAFAVANGMLAVGVIVGLLQIAIAIVGVALFIGAIVSMFMSFGAGEMGDQRARIAAAAREYREQREEQERKKR